MEPVGEECERVLPHRHAQLEDDVDQRDDAYKPEREFFESEL